MADPQELHAPRMHPRDRGLQVVLNWAGGVGGALIAGCYIAGASHQMPLRFAVPGFVAGLVLMTGATIYAFQERTPTKRRSYFWPIVFGSIALAWAVCGWQTWMWFHPAVPSVQVQDTKAQLEAATRPFKEQIEQLTKDNDALKQGNADAASKGTAALRAQIAQLQSVAPVSIDKLPTSLTLSFKGSGVEQIGSAPNVIWTKMFGWQGPSTVFGGGGNPSWVIVIVFKKPIAYKTFCFEGHNSGISLPAAEKNPYYAIITFDPGPLDGLVDLHAANECPK